MRNLFCPQEMREAPRLDYNVPPGPVLPRRALLINPFYPKDPRASFGKHVLTPTLALTSVAAATPSNWDVKYWDENLLQGHPPYDPYPEVVGITVHLTFAKRAYELAAWYRARGAKVILGGPHMVSCPDEAAPHADAICIGEGVSVWPKFLRDVESGKVKSVYRGDYRRPYRNEPLPRRDILPKGSFLTTLSLIASRGCRNRCSFCYLATKGLKMPYHARDVGQVVEEIESSGEPYAVFIDNNLGADIEYFRELCRALQSLDIIWSAAVTVDVTDDPSIVKEMALAGCTGVFVGFESLTDENLIDSNKRCPNAVDYARRVEIFHRYGIQVNGSFVFGFDHDRKDVFRKTVGWIEENRLECATFHILTPYPGTPLFRKMEAEGRLLHRNWELYDTAHAVFRTKHMSPKELEDGYAWCYKRLFSRESIWKRRPKSFLEIPSYLLMTYLYKRSNRLWHHLIRQNLTAAIWRPLVKLSLNKHLRYRRRLAGPDSFHDGLEQPGDGFFGLDFIKDILFKGGRYAG